MSLPVTVVDISDVIKSIVQLLTVSIFGEGATPNPGALTSVTLNGVTFPLSIYRGWPFDDQLQADMQAGGVNVSVCPLAVTRNTTRFQTVEESYSTAPVTTSFAVQGNTVTITGNGSSANALGIAYGTVSATYRPTDGDSPATIAAALAAGLPGASRSGAVLTLPTTQAVIARGVGDVSILTETARSAQRFMISVWAATPALRDLVGAAVHGAMARAVNLSLPYGVTTQSLYLRGSTELQMAERVGVFRRDETWETEFPTIDLIVEPAVLFTSETINTTSVPVE